jgi:hypothetical protein
MRPQERDDLRRLLKLLLWLAPRDWLALGLYKLAEWIQVKER